MNEDKKRELVEKEPLKNREPGEREDANPGEREDVKDNPNDVHTQIPGTDRTEEGYRVIESGLGVDE